MRFGFQLLLFVAATMAGAGVMGLDGLTLAVLLGLTFLGASLLVVQRLDPGREIGLDDMMALGVALRWVMASFTYLVVNKASPGLVAPDEIYYDNASLYYSEFLLGHVPDPYIDASPGGVILTSGIVFRFFGFVPMVPRYINGVLGGWTVVAAGLIGRRLANAEVGRRAALLTAITPSLVLWASLNTKDTATLLGAEMALWAFLEMRDRFRLSMLACFVASLLLVAYNRTYQVSFIVAGVAASFIMAERGRLLRNLGVSVVLGAVVVVIVRTTGAAEFATIRLVDTSTPAGLALLAPFGLFYFFFAPIPFTGTSIISQATTPEMLAWYYLLGSTWRGMVQLTRHRFRAIAPLLVYVGASSIGWSLVVTNVGTLYRYRGQVFFVMIICIATDMVRRKHERAARAAVVPPEIAYARALAARRETEAARPRAAAPANR